jgi:trimeric autotransporter adhesin
MWANAIEAVFMRTASQQRSAHEIVRSNRQFSKRMLIEHLESRVFLSGTLLPTTSDVEFTTSSDHTVVDQPITITPTVVLDGISADSGTLNFYEDDPTKGTLVGHEDFTNSSIPTINIYPLGGNHLLYAAYTSGDVAIRSAPLPIQADKIQLFQTFSFRPELTTANNVVVNNSFVSSPIIPTGTLEVWDGDHKIASMNPPFGTLTLPPMPIGDYALTAHYSGDDNFMPHVTTPAYLIVTDPALPSVTPTGLLLTLSSHDIRLGDALSLQVGFLDPGYNQAKTTPIQIFDNGQLLGVVDGTGGTTQIALPQGLSRLTASYTGDATTAASTSDVEVLNIEPDAGIAGVVGEAPAFQQVAVSAQTIDPVSGAGSDVTGSVTTVGPAPASPAVTVATSAINGVAHYGQPLTISMSVSNAPNQDSVQFSDGAAPLQTAPFGPDGTAAFTTASATLGSHWFSAYDNSTVDGFLGSALRVLIKDDPAVSLNVDSSAANFGDADTLRAAVSSSVATPNGTVTFFDGQTPLGVAAVDSSGLAILITSTLSPGDHSMHARYNGDPLLFAGDSATTPIHIAAATGSPALTEDQKIVETLYAKLLQRTAELSGLTYWTQQIQSGASAQTVAQQIMDSREYRTNAVDHFYLNYLGRHAEAAGLNYWLDALASGRSIESVRCGILASQEYFDLQGDDMNTWIGAMYRNYLERTSADREVSLWRQISDNMSRQQISDAIASSPEADAVRVGSYYEVYLHRDVDSLGLNAWTSLLSTGQMDDAVIAGIVSSIECVQEQS